MTTRTQLLTRTPTLALALTLVLGAGCAHKVKVVTSPPGATITVDGKRIGRSPVSFEEGVFPGQHRVMASKQGHRTAKVLVGRSETDWLWVAGGVGGCLLCAGPSCLVGASLANVALCPACAGCLLTGGDVGAILAIFTAPSLLTVPLVSLGALVGVTPLALLGLSERSPDVIKIKLKPKG